MIPTQRLPGTKSKIRSHVICQTPGMRILYQATDTLSPQLLFELFRRRGVSAVFSGHLHRNKHTRDGDMAMVIISAVGVPSGDDGSGYRIAKVLQDRIDHDYYHSVLARCT